MVEPARTQPDFPVLGNDVGALFRSPVQAVRRLLQSGCVDLPEIFQPHLDGVRYHVCFAVGKYRPIADHADVTVCKSADTVSWVTAQHPRMATVLIAPSIDRSIFEYDGRTKKDLICYMTTPRKHPETAERLRHRYGDRFCEIRDRSEREVAEILKAAKVFVWRGNDQEGSPRPPKEALVAGCLVVGLKSDLSDRYL